MVEGGHMVIARELPITDVGLGAVCGPLESFFVDGLENSSDPHAWRKVDRGQLISVLTAVLSDKFDNYRFRSQERNVRSAIIVY